MSPRCQSGLYDGRADFIKPHQEGASERDPASQSGDAAYDSGLSSENGHKVGFKPAGGIRTAKQALEWQILMNEELGRMARTRVVPLWCQWFTDRY